MDVLFCSIFIAFCIFLGWQLCLLYLTIKVKKQKKISDPKDVNVKNEESLFRPGNNVRSAILSARDSMRNR